MSIGLLLRAELKPSLIAHLVGRTTPEETLGRMGAWIEEFCVTLCPTSFLGSSDGHPTLFVRLHPAAEDVEITFVDASHITASANTSTVGPGYHLFVTDMLRKLGKEFHANWQEPSDEYCDETRYFHSGDQSRVFEEMTTWLQALAGSFFDDTLSAAEGGTRLALPITPSFHWDAPALTPMGPRDTQWLERTARDGANGRDFFSWWTPGLNAEYFLGRAIASMWSDVRWRAPVNDFERKNLHYVAGSLETAHKLDPSLDYPWAEWAEILGLLDDRDNEYDHVRQRGNARQGHIGYRRRDVTVQLPGHWWITIPGSFGEFLPDGDALCAQDPPRGVWYTGYAFTGDVEQSFAHWRSEMQRMDSAFVEQTENYIAVGKIAPGIENGEEYFALTTSNVCPTGRCILTVVFSRPEERDWAISVWKSLQPPGR